MAADSITKEKEALTVQVSDGNARIAELLAKIVAHEEAERMDTNKDGVVDQQEFKAAGGTDTEFERHDKNRDGVLDQDEQAARAEEMTAEAVDRGCVIEQLQGELEAEQRSRKVSELMHEQAVQASLQHEQASGELSHRLMMEQRLRAQVCV